MCWKDLSDSRIGETWTVQDHETLCRQMAHYDKWVLAVIAELIELRAYKAQIEVHELDRLYAMEAHDREMLP